MAKTIHDLNRKFTTIKRVLATEIPRELGQHMLSQAQKNFREQAYTNDLTKKPWADRPFERQLNYKKLDYTGRLRRSLKIKAYSVSKGFVCVSLGTNIPYAKIQNEGGHITPSYFTRRPPHSTKPIKIKISRIQKRQFLGFGAQDTQAFKRIINRRVKQVMRGV